jgi:hypothetical protein
LDDRGRAERGWQVTGELAVATRTLRAIAAFAAVGFVFAAASLLVPERSITTIALVVCFAGAAALAFSTLISLLVVTWGANELPVDWRRPLSSQSMLLLIIGALLLWADAGRPLSMSVAALLLIVGGVAMWRVKGGAHQWVAASGSEMPNFTRASRIGVLALVLALSLSVTDKFKGIDSAQWERMRTMQSVSTIEEAQRAFYKDSGRFVPTLAGLDLGGMSTEGITMTTSSDGFEVRALEAKYGSTCELIAQTPSDSSNAALGYVECAVGPRTKKGVIPGIPLFLLGAVLCAWVSWRPQTPVQKPAS